MNIDYKTISNAEYHAMPELGSSGLKSILENPRDFLYGEKKESEAMKIGSLFHALVLEPGLVEIEFAKMPKVDLRTKEGKAIKAEFDEKNKGKIIVNGQDWETAENLATKACEAVLEIGDFKEKVSDIVRSALCEKSFFATLRDVPCKCRPDILVNLGSKVESYWIVIDLKSCDEPTEENFIKTGNYGYHIQDEFYRQVLLKNGINVERFLFLMCGKSAHSKAYFYEWDDSSNELAKTNIKKGLEKYKFCSAFNEWNECRYDYENMEFCKITKSSVPNYLNYKK